MLCYKDRSFCPARDCKNLECDRNTRAPDFDPGDMPVSYNSGLVTNCNRYEPDESIKVDKVRRCRRCFSPVESTDTPDYSFYCPEHDEDLYEFETILV